MLYVVTLQDIPDNLEIRSRLLEEHMSHIRQFLDCIRLGGPLLASNQEDVTGGLLVVEAESQEAIREMIDNDPYFKAGLWNEVTIKPFREIINGWRTDN